MIIEVMACVCLASGDKVTAPLTADTTTRGRTTEEVSGSRLREGVMLFQSSLQTHASGSHAARSHNPAVGNINYVHNWRTLKRAL